MSQNRHIFESLPHDVIKQLVILDLTHLDAITLRNTAKYFNLVLALNDENKPLWEILYAKYFFKSPEAIKEFHLTQPNLTLFQGFPIEFDKKMKELKLNDNQRHILFAYYHILHNDGLRLARNPATFG